MIVLKKCGILRSVLLSSLASAVAIMVHIKIGFAHLKIRVVIDHPDRSTLPAPLNVCSISELVFQHVTFCVFTALSFHLVLNMHVLFNIPV